MAGPDLAGVGAAADACHLHAGLPACFPGALESARRRQSRVCSASVHRFGGVQFFCRVRQPCATSGSRAAQLGKKGGIPFGGFAMGQCSGGNGAVADRRRRACTFALAGHGLGTLERTGTAFDLAATGAAVPGPGLGSERAGAFHPRCGTGHRDAGERTGFHQSGVFPCGGFACQIAGLDVAQSTGPHHDADAHGIAGRALA